MSLLLYIDGLVFLVLIKQRKPGFLLLGIKWPDKNGFEVYQAIRQHKKQVDWLVIILTASADKETHQQAIQTGCTELLTTPFTMDRFGFMREKYL